MIREDFHLQRQLLNLNATGHRVQADVRDHSVAVVQLADNEVGTFDNAVVTLKRSIDRVNFFDLEDGITLGQGNSISAEIPVEVKDSVIKLDNYIVGDVRSLAGVWSVDRCN